MSSRAGNGKKDGDSNQKNDLKTLLSGEQREGFTLLVADIMELMKKRTLDTFDASFTSEKPQDKNLDGRNPNADQDQASSEEQDKAQALREKREKEISVPKLQELKKLALQHFQKWEMSVLGRVGDVLSTTEATDSKREKSKTFVSAASGPAARPEYKVVGMSDIFKKSKDSAHTEEPDEDNDGADATLIHLYPPVSTTLLSLAKKKRVLILNSTLLLLLSLERYEAHSRILLLYMASSLHLPLEILTEDEVKVAQTLLEAAKHMSAEEEAKKRGEANRTARRWKVGLAGVAGAALIGITGGLAAPLVAAGLGTIMGGLGLGATAAAGLLGALAQSGVIVGALFGAYGGRMTGQMMDAYAKEVEDFAFLPLRGSTRKARKTAEIPAEDRRLRVTIGISGWLTQREDIISPWRALGHQSEIFALRWELGALMNLGTSMESVLKSAAWTVAKKEIISRTIFGSLMFALWPLSFLQVSKVLDNPFSVAKNRADKAGLVLADAIINKAQGERPVTLIGYSLGARMIYSCLMSLAERKAFGLVESAVLIGAPCPSDGAFWRSMKSVVSGRLVNVYSENDYILGFLYRTSSIQLGVAGLQQIGDVSGIENVDVSSIVSGHLRYQYLVGVILQKIGWEDIDRGEVAKEAETIALLDREDEENLREIDPDEDLIDFGEDKPIAELKSEKGKDDPEQDKVNTDDDVKPVSKTDEKSKNETPEQDKVNTDDDVKPVSKTDEKSKNEIPEQDKSGANIDNMPEKSQPGANIDSKSEQAGGQEDYDKLHEPIEQMHF
ncbi:hypothetical protein V493_06381 [Pseudogymnoascus sp. VKM F-4281 (FW-2241)]|nr:hypothetical protein V493_06381 [Pseudogymnoascus sp. VKM F-4281 (FW-2241)]